MEYTAEIISVGTELLLGSIANTDAQMISQGLSALGVNVYYHTVVGDNPGRLREAVNIAKSRSNIIITTGGLGPTYDDLTKQTVCEAFSRPLELHEEEAEALRHYFFDKIHSRHMPESNMQQAMLPVDCTAFHNTCGTAPGCAFEADGVRVVLLPGPPHECREMFEKSAVPYFEKLTAQTIKSHTLRVFGIGESMIDEKLHKQMTTMTNPTIAPYAKVGEVEVRVSAKAESEADAEKLLAPAVAEVRSVLGDNVYGEDVKNLEEVVVALLKEKKLTLSTAESCTGGLVAKRVTDIPGASEVFHGGVVSYVNAVKHVVLSVDSKALDSFGAVSAPVACQMAQGAKLLLHTDISLSTTGLAGPEGDDRGNEVGTVYIALAASEGTWWKKVMCGQGRGRVRTLAAHHALDMVRRYLLGLTMDAEKQE